MRLSNLAPILTDLIFGTFRDYSETVEKNKAVKACSPTSSRTENSNGLEVLRASREHFRQDNSIDVHVVYFRIKI